MARTFETSVTGKAVKFIAGANQFADQLDGEGDTASAKLFRELAQTDRWDVLAGLYDILTAK